MPYGGNTWDEYQPYIQVVTKGALFDIGSSLKLIEYAII